MQLVAGFFFVFSERLWIFSSESYKLYTNSYKLLHPMSLQTDIKAGIKEAMMKKDEVRLTTLRSIQAAIMNEALAKKVDSLSDDDVLTIIRRSVKQHKDSIEQFAKGNRDDLVKNEQAELVVLEEFLPAMMDRAEIKKIAEAKKAEMGITDKSKLGQFVGALMKDLKGRADGSDVKSVAEEILS